MRTIIDLPNQQIYQLAKICKREAISRAEAIRRAVASYLIKESSREIEDEAFGLWSKRKVDGLKYQKKNAPRMGSFFVTNRLKNASSL